MLIVKLSLFVEALIFFLNVPVNVVGTAFCLDDQYAVLCIPPSACLVGCLIRIMS